MGANILLASSFPCFFTRRFLRVSPLLRSARSQVARTQVAAPVPLHPPATGRLRTSRPAFTPIGSPPGRDGPAPRNRPVGPTPGGATTTLASGTVCSVGATVIVGATEGPRVKRRTAAGQPCRVSEAGRRTPALGTAAGTLARTLAAPPAPARSRTLRRTEGSPSRTVGRRTAAPDVATVGTGAITGAS